MQKNWCGASLKGLLMITQNHMREPAWLLPICLVHTRIIGISWNRLLSSDLFTALKMQVLVINPTSAHLFGVLHLALLSPSITLGSWINGMQRKAVSALRHEGKTPPASTTQSREEHWGRNRSKHLSHTLSVWWQGHFLCVHIPV